MKVPPFQQARLRPDISTIEWRSSGTAGIVCPAKYHPKVEGGSIMQQMQMLGHHVIIATYAVFIHSFFYLFFSPIDIIKTWPPSCNNLHDSNPNREIAQHCSDSHQAALVFYYCVLHLHYYMIY